MAKLYGEITNSRGKTVSLSDNERLECTVYDGNMKAYSVIIQWCNLGDIALEGENVEEKMGALVTTREWRNRPQTNDRLCTFCKNEKQEGSPFSTLCRKCNKI